AGLLRAGRGAVRGAGAVRRAARWPGEAGAGVADGDPLGGRRGARGLHAQEGGQGADPAVPLHAAHLRLCAAPAGRGRRPGGQATLPGRVGGGSADRARRVDPASPRASAAAFAHLSLVAGAATGPRWTTIAPGAFGHALSRLPEPQPRRRRLGALAAAAAGDL